MNKYTASLLAAALIAIWQPLSADNVTLTEAGTLAQTLGEDPQAATLTITGPMNAADFHFLAQCSKLTSLDLSGVTIVAYKGKAVLQGLSTSSADELPPYALAGLPLSSITLPSGLSKIGEGALMSTLITSIAIPSGVTSIGQGAFTDCTALTAVTIPAGVTDLGAYAFSGCTSLESAMTSLTSIPAGTFTRCATLQEVTVAPSGISGVGNSAFEGCTSLSAFPFGTAIKGIGTAAFAGSGVVSVLLSDAAQLDSIGAWAFHDCPELLEVTLPAQLLSIGEGAFMGDPKLSGLTLPAGLTDVSDFMLADAVALTDGALLTDKTERVGRYAYKGLSNRESVVLPGTLTYLGTGAMEGWTSIDTIDATQLKNVPSLGDDVWSGVDQPGAKLLVNESVINDFKEAPQWKEFDISVATGIEDVIPDAPQGYDYESLSGRWEGTTLIIESTRPMGLVTLYTIGGARLGSSNAGGATEARLDASRWADNGYVITAELEGGRKGALKLIR